MSQPYGQQPYGQQPQGNYGPGPGNPGPGYGGGMPPAPPEYSAGPVTRPGTVTTAAVLGFVQAGLTLICTIFVVIILGAAQAVTNESESQFGVEIDQGMLTIGWIVAIAGVVGAGLLIWASVKTLGGTAGQLMVIAAALQLVLCIVWLAALGGGIVAVILAVMPIISLVMVLGGPAKQYEASKRGQLA
jgi:hypothetical protein